MIAAKLIAMDERNKRVKVLGINGSHRAGKGTAALLQAALDGAAEQGAAMAAEREMIATAGAPVATPVATVAAMSVACELVELSRLDIGFCIGCNRCLAQTSCTLADDMNDLYVKLRDADVVLLASPDYFGTVSARMKNFMDRTRPFHMVENVLTGKVGGALSTAGLNNCGGEGTLALLGSWFATQGMLAVHPRTQGTPLAGGVVATGFAGLSEEGQPQWRSVKGDEIGFALARQLGREAVSLAARLR